MTKKIFILLLFLTTQGCIGFTSGKGLSLRSGEDIVKLRSGEFISFKRPIGGCGASVKFFGILLPIIPIWVNSNSCEKSFDIDLNYAVSLKRLERGVEIKLKYNGVVHDSIAQEKLTAFYGNNGEAKSEYGTKFKFKINDFQKFRQAKDKAIIIIGRTRSGKSVREKILVDWSLMTYGYWVVPG